MVRSAKGGNDCLPPRENTVDAAGPGCGGLVKTPVTMQGHGHLQFTVLWNLMSTRPVLGRIVS